jgi:hypothetical protein
MNWRCFQDFFAVFSLPQCPPRPSYCQPKGKTGIVTFNHESKDSSYDSAQARTLGRHAHAAGFWSTGWLGLYKPLFIRGSDQHQTRVPLDARFVKLKKLLPDATNFGRLFLRPAPLQPQFSQPLSEPLFDRRAAKAVQRERYPARVWFTRRKLRFPGEHQPANMAGPGQPHRRH